MANFDAAVWNSLLQRAVAENWSDIHLTSEQMAFGRKDGRLFPLPQCPMREEDLVHILTDMLDERQRGLLTEQGGLDFAWSWNGQRFRWNIFQQRGKLAAAVRIIPSKIPDLAELGYPAALADMADEQNGLLLVSGRTGAGKTTTLAAFIDLINRSRSAHIITLEDPVEYLHVSQQCLVQQREFGIDFFSFASALRSSLRQDPDIILVGELRDAETILTALNAAETGHLVLGSLHTRNAAEAVLRIESMFPARQQEQVRAQLAIVLSGIFSQQLLPASDGGRVCAVEVLRATPAVRNLIRTGKVQQLSSTMLSGLNIGMQTMEMAVERLRRQERITDETARRYLR